jgi:hypothetical protein
LQNKNMIKAKANNEASILDVPAGKKFQDDNHRE